MMGTGMMKGGMAQMMASHMQGGDMGNVDPAPVSSALEELRQATLADLVTAGTLTQDQADTMLEHMNKIGTSTLKYGKMMQAGGYCQAQKSPAN